MGSSPELGCQVLCKARIVRTNRSATDPRPKRGQNQRARRHDPAAGLGVPLASGNDLPVFGGKYAIDGTEPVEK